MSVLSPGIRGEKIAGPRGRREGESLDVVEDEQYLLTRGRGEEMNHGL